MSGHRCRPPGLGPLTATAFTGFRFPPEVIMLAVRWYLRFGLSYRDVEELLAEAARPCRHAVGDRWQVDETYLKVGESWHYLYRAIDQFGQVIDVLLSRQRYDRAARRFFAQALASSGSTPAEVVTDKAPSYVGIMDELLPGAFHNTEHTPTTASRPITAGSRHGFGRCPA